MRALLVTLAAVIAHGFAACAETIEPVLPVPTSVQVVGGDGQDGVYGMTLPDSLRVRVTDQKGDPVAGVRVSWSGSIGPISPSETLTDASGLAASAWTLGTVPGSAKLGEHTATASVSGLVPATFNSHLRLGLNVESVSIDPDHVNVASSPATVVVSVRATDDFYTGVTTVAVRLLSPSEDVVIGLIPLAFVSGTPHDGTWEGGVEIPHGAEAGAWTLNVHVRSEESWLVVPAGALEYRGLPFQLTVTNTS